MDCWFEFFDIHMNEKKTCHYFHGFKWQNINIYPILIIFLYDLTFYFSCWIMSTPNFRVINFNNFIIIILNIYIVIILF